MNILTWQDQYKKAPVLTDWDNTKPNQTHHCCKLVGVGQRHEAAYIPRGDVRKKCCQNEDSTKAWMTPVRRFIIEVEFCMKTCLCEGMEDTCMKVYGWG